MCGAEVMQGGTVIPCTQVCLAAPAPHPKELVVSAHGKISPLDLQSGVAVSLGTLQ